MTLPHRPHPTIPITRYGLLATIVAAGLATIWMPDAFDPVAVVVVVVCFYRLLGSSLTGTLRRLDAIAASPAPMTLRDAWTDARQRGPLRFSALPAAFAATTWLHLTGVLPSATPISRAFAIAALAVFGQIAGLATDTLTTWLYVTHRRRRLDR